MLHDWVVFIAGCVLYLQGWYGITSVSFVDCKLPWSIVLGRLLGSGVLYLLGCEIIFNF